MLKLRLLGNAGLEYEAGSIAGRAVQPRRIALLAVLGLARKAVSRDKLLALLWPESDTEQARHLLSVSVYELRKALGENVIATARDELSLSDEVVIDAVEFERAVASGDYEHAVAMYSGPLLDGFHISDAPEFEHWVDGERNHMARRYAEALEKLAQQRTAGGDNTGALSAWRQFVAHDPYSARAVSGLMLALEANGDRTGAMQQARAHAALLRDEFGAEPDPDVEALAARLRSAPPGSRIPAPALSVAAARPQPIDAPPLLTIERPRRKHLLAGLFVLAVIITVLIVWQNRQRAATVQAAAIAVLPFANVSPSDSAVYFSDGLTDAIIGALSRVSEMRVASRNSSFRFRGPQDVRDVARQLGVDYALEGSVRLAGGRMKVTALLIGAVDGLEVWSEEYDREFEMQNFIDIQEEIAQSVVRALVARFDDKPPLRLVQASTTNMQAFETFVVGRDHYHRRTVADLQLALQFFALAIQQDPSYGLAHASMAEVYALLGAYDYGALPPKVAFAEARKAAERALEIDPNLPEAHNALASVLFNYDWDWSAAEREFQRAIQLSPGYSNAHHWYSLLLHCSGRQREALQAIMRARELDPLSPVIGTALARHHYLARNFDAAVQGYARTAEEDSTFVTARVGFGMSLAARGDFEGAVREFEHAERLLKVRTPLIDGLIANAYGRAGRRAEALARAASIQEAAKSRYVPAEYLAVAFIGLGDHDRAFAALEQAFANRSAGLAYLAVEPLVDPLRGDPRLDRLIAKISAARK